MKTKKAYLIMTGEKIGETVSNRFRCKKNVRRAIKAAKRMGFKNAYAVEGRLNVDCKTR